MIESGRRAAPTSTVAGPAETARRRAALLLGEVAVGSVDLARIGLLSLALALQTIVLVSPGHFRPAGTPFFAVLVSAGTLLSLGLCLAATLPLKRLVGLNARRLLGLTALAALLVLTVIGVLRGGNALVSTAHGPPYNNDGAVMDLYSAQQVLRGHNPYIKTNIVLALADMDAPATTTTPLREGQFRGAMAYPSAAAIEQVFLNVLRHRNQPGVPIPQEFESKYNYPAGSFLFILPLVAMGLHDMRLLYALALVLMGVYLWFRMSRALRPLVPLFLLSSVPVVVLTAGGQPDPIYGLFLLIGYAEWRRRWVSPLALGIAIATKQLAWFFLPFYLVLTAREYGWREASRRCGIVSLVFLVTNGPFIAQSPGAYLASVSGPMQDPMFPLGVGIVAVFVSNVLPMLPKLAFTLAELGTWLGGATAFARLRERPQAAAVVLAALPLFFAWRSLVNYFYLVPLLTLAVILADGGRDDSVRAT